MSKNLFGLIALFLLSFTSISEARDQIRIVGSSTVFPFATAVAENFGKTTSFKTPVVESTGSGGGMKLFCAGVGVGHPDITNASRRIKSSEYKKCMDKGIGITEVKIGFDGIVIANSKKSKRLAITKKHIFQALAHKVPVNGKLVDNPYKLWSDIDKSLPSTKIEVLGPPPTSGTRDAFSELALEGGAKKFPSLAALRKKNKKAFKKIAHSVREDGAFIEAGENAEEALIREVKEEVNVEVSDITYYSSQSWPFPAQLMLGYFCKYKSGDIFLNDDELEDARWFHINDLPIIPPVTSISGQLIRSYIEDHLRL